MMPLSAFAVSTAIGGAPRWQFSGLVQGRFEAREDTPEGAANVSTFHVRRARFKVRASLGKQAGMLIHMCFDKGKAGLKDAILTWRPPNSGISLTVGQTKWNFGHHLRRSTGWHDVTMEKPKVVEEFFPGKRDRGLVVSGRLPKAGLEWDVGIWNGQGITPGFTNDPNDAKDICLRVGNFLGKCYFGPAPRLHWQVSAYIGKQYARPAGVATFSNFTKTRYGLAVQYHFEPAPKRGYKVEGSTVMAEAIWGKGYGKEDKWHDAKAYGFYIEAHKNFVGADGAAESTVTVRYGRWMPKDARKTSNLALCYIRYLGPHMRTMAGYEFIEGERYGNRLSVQVQVTF